MATADYCFFSEFQSKQVTDSAGRSAGRIHDLALGVNGAFPRATHLILRRGWLAPRYAAVPWADVEGIFLTVHLRIEASGLLFSPSPPALDFSLVRDILDQQVVDTDGQKVIRVNDARLLQVGTELRLSDVDVGLRGIVRRLGWQRWVDLFVETFLARTDYLKENLIHWTYVQPLAINPQKGTLKLTVGSRQIASIPQGDFNELLQSMDVHQRLAFFNALAADLHPRVFSSLSLEQQKELLENMDLREAADLLSGIPADQTTDLLEEMPRSVADSVLAHMESTQARRLSALLGHTSDSAGGLMTTEMITVPHDAPVSEALSRVRAFQEHLDNAYHAYLVDAEGRLVKIVLLKRLLLAQPADPVSQYAYPRPFYVRATDPLREVVFALERHKAPAIPVINNSKERLLQGVITIDDILARVVPIAWRRRVKS